MAKLSLNNLLKDGYFPKELPPTFTTATYASAVSKKPASFEGAASGVPSAALCRFNLARPGTLRRPLAIPNPATHFGLAKLLVESWSSLGEQFDKSTISLSRPTFSSRGERAVEPNSARPLLLEARTELRAVHRFVLKADISQFYPSVYTHAVPWALHGKSFAKSKKNRNDKTLLGNRIDFEVRKSQEEQTRGIPVGADTSFVIAEALLSDVDRLLEERIPDLQGFRYYDDFELYFTSLSEAAAAVNILEESLGAFELSLAPEKTHVTPVSQSLDLPWSAIRRIDVRESARRQKNDLVFLFEEALAIARSSPRDHVLKYAIGRVEDRKIHEDNWKLYQGLLCQAVMVEPAVLPLVLREWIRYKVRDGLSPDTEMATKVINLQILQNAPTGNSSEVSWAIWGALALELKIGAEATRSASEMPDSAVALLALDALERGILADGETDDSWWNSQMNADALTTEHWLLAYEADVKGWVSNPKRSGYTTANPAFKFLASRGVSFYEPNYEHESVVTHSDVSSDAVDDDEEDQDEDEELEDLLSRMKEDAPPDF